ncbi:MAG: site-specific integrase [Acidiferrobacterales bacterium]
MPTFEHRKDKDGNVITIRVKIRRRGLPLTSKNFDVHGPKVSDLNAALRHAEKWARMIESEMDRGAFVSRAESESTTLRECLERYAREITPQKKGAAAEFSKIEILKAHPIAERVMVTIRGSDVAQYRDGRTKLVGPATIVRELGTLSHVFNIARREWGMENLANPVQVVRKPKLPQGRERRLFPGELNAIIAASESAELCTILQLELETAMRRGELTALLWCDVHLKSRYLQLRDTKNGDARTVPLSSKAIKLLSNLPRRLDGRVWGMRADSITHAFERARDRARRRYEEKCKESGDTPKPCFLKELRFHDLRHEATSRFFEKGLNPIEAAAVTGHKDLRMLKRYTHLNPTVLAEKLG